MSLSELDGADYINLVGQYNSLTRDRGKSEVDDRLTDRGYTPEQLEQIKEQSRARFNPIKSLNLRFKKHLSNFEYDYFDYVMTLYDQYKKGNLPFEGPLSEQPAQIIETFSVLQALENEHEARLNAQARKQTNGRQQRKN